MYFKYDEHDGGVIDHNIDHSYMDAINNADIIAFEEVMSKKAMKDISPDIDMVVYIDVLICNDENKGIVSSAKYFDVLFRLGYLVHDVEDLAQYVARTDSPDALEWMIKNDYEPKMFNFRHFEAEECLKWLNANSKVLEEDSEDTED